MANYIKLVQSQAELTSFKASNDFITPNVTAIYGDIIVDYSPYVALPHDYSLDYFTIEALTSGTLNFTNDNSENGYLQYSLDDGETWSEEYGSIEDLSLNANDKLLIKGDITLDDGSSDGNYVSYTGDFNVYGNIMSLVYGDNFANQTSLAGKNYIFANLFYEYENKTLLNTENLILPATTLANGCYFSMFSGCSLLTTTPELPATTLSYDCYGYMFSDCTSLTTAPELPATILFDGCYNCMFSGCTSLTAAPELLATTMTSYCYYGMFQDCTSLTTTPSLPATTLAFSCYDTMFSGCTSLITTPSLPATTLADYCYNNMFKGCTNLNNITCLATDISATDCTYNWVDGVAASGTFTKADSMTDWTTGIDGIPSGWTVQDYVAS